ncbi:MAG: hypothetical protein EAY70_00085 [Sphingomonadales bacterium]|nr:MAG: hypothetical protein EAY70_00085 [Sphingomonadales bacterium]
MIFAAFLWAYWGGLPYISAAITFSFALYLSVFILLNRKKNDDLFPNTARLTAKKLSDEEAKLWLNKLEQLMEDQQIFKNPNLKLQDLGIGALQVQQFLQRENFANRIDGNGGANSLFGLGGDGEWAVGVQRNLRVD